MAYSKSPVTLIRRKRHVESLFRGERTRWVAPFPEGADAATWAYKVRECLHVAFKHKRHFPELFKFAKLYKVKVLNDTTVEAFVEDGEDSTPSMATESKTSQNTPTTLPGTTRFDIVNAFREGVLGEGPWIFPAVQLGMVDRKKLEAWAKTFEPSLSIQETQGGGIMVLLASRQL